MHRKQDFPNSRAYSAVGEKTLNTPSTLALLKWGYFDRVKPIFEMPLVSLIETESTEEV